MTDQKYVYASPDWIECAGRILTDMVSEFGEEGQSFSFCEILCEAPKEFAEEDGRVYWSVYVDGKKCRSIRGRAEETDLVLQGTWELALDGARRVYTPELLEEWAKNPPPPPDDPNMDLQGDMSILPPWMTEFHNRVALVTD